MSVSVEKDEEEIIAESYLASVYVQDQDVDLWLRRLEEGRLRDLEGFQLCANLDMDKIPIKYRNRIKITQLGPPHIHRSIVCQQMRDVCPRCWLSIGACMCDLIPPVALPSHVHVHFLVHYEEYLRASNTVKLIERSVQFANRIFFDRANESNAPASDEVVWPGKSGGPPELDGKDPITEEIPFLPPPTVDLREVISLSNEDFQQGGSTEEMKTNKVSNGTVEMLVYGVEEHHKRLEALFAHIDAESADVLVLFPSGDSIMVDEYLKIKNGSDSLSVRIEETKTLSASKISTSGSSERPIHILVLDGTWRQANHMHHRFLEPLCKQLIDAGKLRKMPYYVKIDPMEILPESKSLFHPLRTQTQDDRCCTLEATVALLKKLGVSDSLVIQPLFYALRCLVDSLQTQSGFSPSYGTLSKSRYTRMKSHRRKRSPGFRETSRNTAKDRSKKFMCFASSVAAASLTLAAASRSEDGEVELQDGNVDVE